MKKHFAVLGWFAEPGLELFEGQKGEEMIRVGKNRKVFNGIFDFADENKFAGVIYDDYGEAKLSNGLLINGTLRFIKTYKNRIDPIEYQLIRQDDTNLYKGSYKCKDGRTGISRLLTIEAPLEFFA